MATKVQTCRACGSAEIRKHCAGAGCDGWRCVRCTSWGTETRLYDARSAK